MQPESRLQMSHSPLIQTLNLCQRHLQPMSLCQSGSHPLSQCYVACLNVRQTPKLTAGDTGDAVHLFTCFPELKLWRLLKLQMFFSSFDFQDEVHAKNRRFDYGEQRCDYQTLKVPPVHHWAFPSSAGHSGGQHYGVHCPGLSYRGVTASWSSGREGSAISCWKQLRSLLAHHPQIPCSF